MTNLQVKLLVNDAIWKTFPGLKLGVLILKGIDNSKSIHDVQTLFHKAQHDARNKFADHDLGSVDKLSDWREAYRSFGFKPSKGRCSADALLRRVIKGSKLPEISALVDIYNAISLKHIVPVGGDDLDHLDGNLQLTYAKDGDTFQGIGSAEPEKIPEGEIVYKDNTSITTRAWNFRECDRSKLTQNTKNAMLVVEGLDATSHAEVAAALNELKSITEQFLGGDATAYLIDAEKKELSDDTLLENRTFKTHIPEPEYHKYESYRTRKEKLEEILASGMNPYPHKFTPTNSASDLLAKYESDPVGTFEKAQEGVTDSATIAGRLILFRAMGSNIFAHILDETHKIQVVFNKEFTGVTDLKGDLTPIKFIEKKLDLGDILGISGHLFRTQKGEITLFAKEVTLLCKTLLGLPDKHKGITDKGVRYRKRWLDLIVHPDVNETFRTRSKILNSIRRYFEEFNFLEVETPTLQNIYGGAQAKPFTTHHNALSQDMYLRISLEIALKKLVVGGMNRIFEIGKVFRNEGIDRTHNPEFTMLEAYAAFWDYNDVMHFIENLYERLAIELFGTSVIGERLDKDGNAHIIDVKAPWIRLTMKGAIKKYGKIDADDLSDDEMKKHLAGKVDPEKLANATRGNLIAMLFEEFAEEHLIQPHHITDHPIETTPLCKPHRNDEMRDEGLVERFESFILGVECCNAYSELNDPILQRKLLEDQAQSRDAGDDEANPMDEEFIESICQGLPPAGGLGIGIDRLCMLFANATSIRDVLFFPVMRPEE